MSTSTQIGDTQTTRQPEKTLVLTGNNLTITDLIQLSRWEPNSPPIRLALSPEAEQRVQNARQVVDQIVSEKQVVYGISTGFGCFSDTVVNSDQLSELQVNLIRSHCCGVGQVMTLPQIRILLALRINVFLKGHSGIRLENIYRMIAAFNSDCLSWVPDQGTVGASGDLAPLSHLALGLIGEGKMWNPSTECWDKASTVLKDHGLTPVELTAKEGLAMINGTQFICTYASLAMYSADLLAEQADVIGCLTLEALWGCRDFMDERVHEARPHPEQQKVATRLRQLLGDSSEMYNSAEGRKARAIKTQDAYSLRCLPQVHGATRQVLNGAREILEVEINSATDNPMVFPFPEDEDDGDKSEEGKSGEGKSGEDESKKLKKEKKKSIRRQSETGHSHLGQILSAGNFHGEFPAKASDLISLAVTELSNISERRLERLLNPQTEKTSGLPTFLIPKEKGGLHSGFMITQYTAAGLVAENRTRTANPSSETIPTCGNQEDHVSMGGYAARNSWQIVQNTAHVMAIELIAACQAIEYRRPLKTTPALEAVYELVRKYVPAADDDRVWSDSIMQVAELLLTGAVAEVVRPFLSQAEERAQLAMEKKAESVEIGGLRIPRGTRDFGPDQMVIREKVIDRITQVFKMHGAETIGTPVFELKEILMSKYGEDEKLIFDLADQGSGTKKSLRYDLTVPFARYVAMNNVTKMKRYQIGEVYRRDAPIMSKGRYRAFYQCDFDIAGDYGGQMIPDAECLYILHQVLSDLEIGCFQIKVNHRELLQAIYRLALEAGGQDSQKGKVPEFGSVCSSIDKLDKLSWFEVRRELIETRGLSEAGADLIGQLVSTRGKPREILSKIQDYFSDEPFLTQIGLLFDYLESYGFDLENSDTFSFDLSLARGLSYYTGLIFEAVYLGPDPNNPQTMLKLDDDFHVGSIAGGGRYDDLIGMFGKNQVPSIGFSVGIERIFTIIQRQLEYAQQPVRTKETQVLVASVGKGMVGARQQICNLLWRAGLSAESLYSPNPRMKQQLEYALRYGIPVMLIVGESEVERKVVQMKVLETKVQTEVPLAELVSEIQSVLAE